MTDPENEASSWWAAGVVGPRPIDDLQRRGDAPAPGNPLWRFRNDREVAVVLDVPGHKPSTLAPGEAVEFLARGGTVLAVADPERPGVVLETGPVERLAESSSHSRGPR